MLPSIPATTPNSEIKIDSTVVTIISLLFFIPTDIRMPNSFCLSEVIIITVPKTPNEMTI